METYQKDVVRLNGPKMHLKRLSKNDVNDLLEWRNDKKTVAMSLSEKLCEVGEHHQWFGDFLRNSESKGYVGYIQNDKIGLCRFAINNVNFKYEVSINLNPNFRGKGHSFSLLRLSIEEFRKFKDLDLYATIKKENVASQKIFERFGFVLVGKSGSIYSYELSKSKT